MQDSMPYKEQTGYVAPEGGEEALFAELKHVIARYGRLFLAEGAPQKVHWAQNIWFSVRALSFSSIGDAAKQLRALGSLWVHHPYASARRGELIVQRLPFFSPKPMVFPSPLPKTPLGAWMLLDEHTLLCAPRCSSPFARGEPHFVESRDPPSRAYLKLWEALTLMEKRPVEKEVCLEVGASPGSWTWALQKMGAEVIAVDRAPLAPSVSALPRISFLKKDAFSLRPEEFPQVSWVLSDVICYPEKLLEWILPWVDRNVNLVCTLKFQGKPKEETLRRFENIPNSRLFHLFANKNELTWIRPGRSPFPRERA